MKSITFSCDEVLDIGPDVIAQHILDVSKWRDFKGYGVLPGIKLAEFEVKAPGIVGSRIRVINTDGSTHVEEIMEWQPHHRIRMHMKEFSAPLSRLATGIEETWDFKRIGTATRASRSFEMHATSAFTRPLLWLISILLKKAIARHLRQLREETGS
jgi:Polyketide cyclase / dehydrase and lipid transport